MQPTEAGRWVASYTQHAIHPGRSAAAPQSGVAAEGRTARRRRQRRRGKHGVLSEADCTLKLVERL